MRDRFLLRDRTGAKAQDAGKKRRGVSSALENLHRKLGNRGTQKLLQGRSATISEAGQPLPAEDRNALAPHFGSVIHQARIHTDETAALATQELGARAFNVGRDIYLDRKLARAPASDPIKQHTLIHELVHTSQQANAAQGAPSPATRPATSDPYEREARDVASSLSWGRLQDRYSLVAPVRGPGPATAAERLRPRLTLTRTAPQLVELTYDDGPDTAGNTRKILDHLNKAGAKATFYVVGRRVIEGNNYKTVFDIAASGNWLGNHAFDWDLAKDNHIFLQGSSQERARKILITEWAIRDALIRGKKEAQASKSWDTIPKANQDYIDDVIAHGTGRFRTPGFRSKWWREDGRKTIGAIAQVNEVLAASGLRIFEVSDEVTIDPKDWEKGKTAQQVRTGVVDELSSATDSILLHSRLAISEQATPDIIAAIKKKGWSFDAPARGKTGQLLPGSGFAGLKKISDPPTAAEVAQAKKFLFDPSNHGFGGVLMGYVGIGIFKMAQQVGESEVRAFMKELLTTPGPPGTGYMENFLNENSTFALMFRFMKEWLNKTPFPTGKGVKY